MKHYTLAVASSLALSAFLVASPAFAQGGRTDANGMPTDHSTPAEAAETARINNSVSAGNRAIDAQTSANNAQYQAQQQQYQDQLRQNQAQQDQYQDKTARYNALRARYAAERAAYHRGVWPDRYEKWVILERDANLVGERVELITGNRVGTVIDTAHRPNGHIEAVLVKLDNSKIVWIDSSDIRYNRADGIVMTNLDSGDLHHMADERL